MSVDKNSNNTSHNNTTNIMLIIRMTVGSLKCTIREEILAQEFS